MVNANVSIASGAKRKAGDERQDTGRSGISKNQLGRDAGKWAASLRLIHQSDEFRSAIPWRAARHPSDIRRSWIATWSITLKVIAHVHHIGRLYAPGATYSELAWTSNRVMSTQ